MFRFKTILLFIHKAVTLCAIGSSVDDEPPDTVCSASEAKLTGVMLLFDVASLDVEACGGSRWTVGAL